MEDQISAKIISSQDFYKHIELFSGNFFIFKTWPSARLPANNLLKVFFCCKYGGVYKLRSQGVEGGSEYW